MNVEQAYARLNTSQLISIYRKWLQENNMQPKNKKVEGIYPWPIINGEKYSWRQFRKLPRDALLVFVLTQGCNLAYINKLEAQNFFVEQRDWHKRYGLNPWDKIKGEEE